MSSNPHFIVSADILKQDPITLLQQAIAGEADLEEILSIFAMGFPIFIENESIFQLPDEILAGVLSHPEITYPDDPEITGHFFLQILKHGSSIAQIFFDVIPLDKLTMKICDEILECYQNYGLKREVRILKRFHNFYLAQENQSKELIEVKKQFKETSDKLHHSTELLQKMTALLKQSNLALIDSTAELNKKNN